MKTPTITNKTQLLRIKRNSALSLLCGAPHNSEIDPFACAVVEHHWNPPNLGDMTRITKEKIHGHGTVDLVCGGTPCQSFSLAGRRKGLDDPRGDLALVFLRIVGLARPRWVLWENVPGVLSSSGGRDFGAFLAALGQLGYGFCWRVLDAQFFGVPQRRRRIFVVGYLGDWRPAAAVLLEPEGLRGNPSARRKARAEVAKPLTNGAGGCSSTERRHTAPSEGEGRLLNALPVAFDCKQDGRGNEEIAPTLRAMSHDSSRANGGGQVGVAYPLDLRNIGRDRPGMGLGRDSAPAPTCTAGPVAGVAYSFQPRIGRSGRGRPSHVAPALAGADAGATSDSRPCVALSVRLDNGSAYPLGGVKVAPTIRQGAGPTGAANVAVCTRYAVRRLTPRECERLQGFLDDYTLVEFRDKPASDGPRYRALGNSMAVPVVAWIGRRIDLVNQLLGHKIAPAARAGAMEVKR